MVNMEYSTHAAQLYHHKRKNIRASVGLHFNLTEGKPLSVPISSSRIVEEGLYVGKQKFYEIIKEDPECLSG